MRPLQSKALEKRQWVWPWWPQTWKSNSYSFFINWIPVNPSHTYVRNWFGNLKLLSQKRTLNPPEEFPQGEKLKINCFSRRNRHWRQRAVKISSNLKRGVVRGLIIKRPRDPILEEVYGCLNEDQHLIGLERWFKDNKRTVYLHLLNDQFTFNIMGKIVSLK